MTGSDHPPAPLHIRAAGQWPAGAVDAAGNLILSPETLAALSSIAEPQHVTAGTTIFHQGDTALLLGLVQSGVVRMSHHLEDGRTQIMAFHWQGDLFGLADNGVYSNQAVALTDCDIVVVRRPALKALFVTIPQLQGDFLVEATADLRLSERHLLLVTHQRVIKRLAGFLLECTQQPECYNPATGVLTLIMDRSDIADYLGTTIETISRTFGVLEEKKLTSRTDPRHIRLNVAGLKLLLRS